EGHYQGAQVATPYWGEAIVGATGQIEGKGHPLVKGEEAPVAADWGAQSLPTQNPEASILDGEQDAQLLIALGARSNESIAYVVAKEGLTQHDTIVFWRKLAPQIFLVKLEA